MQTSNVPNEETNEMMFLVLYSSMRKQQVQAILLDDEVHVFHKNKLQASENKLSRNLWILH